MLKNKGGFLTMIVSMLGIVVFSSMLPTVMGFLDDLLLVVGLGDLLVFELCIQIAPVIILLGGIGGLGYAYYKGYKAGAVKDANGLMRIVTGVLGLVIFLAMFPTIATIFVDLYTTYAGGDYIAFDVVISVVPTLLFLGGVFATVSTSVQGVRARSRGRALA